MKLFDEIPEIEDEYLMIRRLEEKDAPALEAMEQNENVRRYLPTFLFEFSFEDKKEAVREMYGDIFYRKESLLLGIYLRSEPDELAGICEVYNYDPDWNKASLGCRLREEFWNRKIGETSIRMMVDYLFNKTDVKRITVHVMSDNTYSLRAVERLGFRLRKKDVPEDWGFEEPVTVNKFVLEKLGNISYAKIGDGPEPMVMLPGLALKSTLGSADLIEENYRMFSGYTIYLFDDRDNIGEGYTIRERAGDVAAEMKTLHIKHANVFGASMGGMVGQYLAIDHPDLVKNMVISATCPYINDAARSVITRWRDLAAKGNVSTLVHESIRDIYSEEVVKKFGAAFEEGIGAVTDYELDKFVRLSDAILGFDSREDLDRIRANVLVVGSEGDRVLGVEGSRIISSRLGCSTKIYGPEYGHGVYDEAPDHRQGILDFFEMNR